jgi:glycosyltransferase involved in cell wall biosynthesis
MKVLLVSHSSALYGAQRSLIDLATGLRDQGIEVVGTAPEAGPLVDLLECQGFDVRIMPCRNWVHSRTAYHWYRKWVIAHRQARIASDWIGGEGFDLIHTNSVVTPVGALAAKSAGLPHVWHVREGMPPKPDFFFMPFAKVRRFIQETTRFMVGISKHSCEGMKSFCPPDRIRLVYNGPISKVEASDDSFRREGLNNPLRLLCVGRVSLAKGHDVAARGLALLRTQGIDARLSIAGDVAAEFRDDLLKIAPEGLHFLGFVQDTSELYRKHDILLMTSQKEAFGRVTVEAMARGCLVVGTDSGGTPELIEHGQSGLIFQPGDAKELAEHVASLVGNGELIMKLRVNAHCKAFSEFTRERYARQVAELYREALDGA